MPRHFESFTVIHLGHRLSHQISNIGSVVLSVVLCNVGLVVLSKMSGTSTVTTGDNGRSRVHVDKADQVAVHNLGSNDTTMIANDHNAGAPVPLDSGDQVDLAAESKDVDVGGTIE